MSRGAKVGKGVAAGALVALGVWWWLRPTDPGWRRTPGHETPESAWDLPVDGALAAAAFERARGGQIGSDPVEQPPRATASGVWLCRYDPPPARCGGGVGPLLRAIDDAAADLRAQSSGPAPFGVLKLDIELASEVARWPDDPRPHEAGAFGFRVGDAVVLPSEVLEKGLFRAVKEDTSPTWDDERLRAELTRRGAAVGAGPFSFDRLRTASFVQAGPGEPVVRTYRLHRWEDPEIDVASLERRWILAAEHLASTVSPSGRIRYLYATTEGRERSGYNLLRHAGTTWSLYQAYGRTTFEPWRRASDAALSYLMARTQTDHRTGPFGGGDVRYVVEGSHLKLGGVGLALLVLAERRTVTGDRQYDGAAREFARFLVSQQRATGEFVSFPSKDPGGPPRDDVSAYYPGEAILGLTAWYGHEPDSLWRDTAVRGADWLIDQRDAGRGPERLDNDHWLMMALERLWAATGDPRYVDHAVRLGQAVVWQARRQAGHGAFHRDYAGGFYEPPRSTPAAIRVEGLLAVARLCRAAGCEVPGLEEVLVSSLAHVVRAQIEPDLAWYAPDPKAAIGGVAGGIVDPDLRNDYSQHAMSGWIGASSYFGGSSTLTPDRVRGHRAPLTLLRGPLAWEVDDTVAPAFPGDDPGENEQRGVPLDQVESH